MEENQTQPNNTETAASTTSTVRTPRTASRGAISPKRTFARKTQPGTGGTPTADGRQPNSRGPRRPGGDRNRSTFQHQKPEFDQKIISIRRVTRVVSGGRRLSFAVSMIIGDKKGSMGVGTGKAVDTALAIAKALKNARKNLVKLKLTKNMSIPYDVAAKYATARITLTPNKGKGIVAGSSARDILKLGGLKDVTAKFHSGSKNKLNNARVTIEALSLFIQKGGFVFETENKNEVAEEVLNQS